VRTRDSQSGLITAPLKRGYAIDIDAICCPRRHKKKSILPPEDIFKDVDVLLSPAAAGEAPVV